MGKCTNILQTGQEIIVWIMWLTLASQIVNKLTCVTAARMQCEVRSIAYQSFSENMFT